MALRFPDIRDRYASAALTAPSSARAYTTVLAIERCAGARCTIEQVARLAQNLQRDKCRSACRDALLMPACLLYVAGLSSIARHLRLSLSALMICVPEPENGSRTTSPSKVCHEIGRAKISVAYCVG